MISTMRINENVHLIRIDFNVMPEVKRYINVYLITGKHCYLVDTGIAGTETVIADYMESIGRKITDIKGIFLTHSHPDHAGGAAALKRLTGCKIYAPYQEILWIENIQNQFTERPIPNFYKLLSESVKVDQPLYDGNLIDLEEGIKVTAIATPGHSHGSMSFVLNNHTVFTGDAIPVAHDLPIFVDFEESIKSLDRFYDLLEIDHYCPAWDRVYGKEEIENVLVSSKEMLYKLKNAVCQVESELSGYAELEREKEALKRADMLQYYGNLLVRKSLEACKNVLK